MKRKVDHLSIILVLFALSIAGCDMFTRTDKKETISKKPIEGENNQKNTFSAYLTSFKKKSALCRNQKRQCAEVAVQYPFFKGKQTKFINSEIQKRVKSSLNSVISEDRTLNVSVEKMAQLIIDDYNDFINEFKDENEKWDISLSVINTFQKNNLIAFSLELDADTGGAHPNKTVSNFIIDFKNNELIKLSDLVSNIPKFTSAAEKVFRKKNSIPKSKSLQEEGYFFEKGKFNLNNNIGISQNGITVYFNSYEIAPYAMGPTKIVVPFYEIKDILKIKV